MANLNYVKLYYSTMKKILLSISFICAANFFAYADPCTSIQQIFCGNIIQFNSNGFGDPNYPNGLNGQGCSAGTAQGGQEAIYRFIVPATGTYQINCTTTTNDYTDYYYRTDNDSCNKTGWTCINRNINSNRGLGAYNWNTGDTILLLLNAESTGPATQSFIITCAAVVCNIINSISCGDTIQFNSNGFGDPNYPNGLNGQGCSAGTAQGGQEAIYRFIVPATGTYQINCTTTTNDYIDYYYRTDNDSCNKTGWTCINRNINSNRGLGAYNWNTGDTILLLLNAESTGPATQSFTITCATVICNVINTISCGDTIQFNSNGFGDPSYPNGLNGQGCSAGTAQGGQEAIYRFVVPATGTYQINCTTTTNDYIDYYYRTDNDSCNKTGWTCINRNINYNTGLGAYNWIIGDTILLLLNAESTGPATQSFTITCAEVACYVINTINYGDTIQFNSFGFGDPAYPNGLNGQGCSAGTAQGGQEIIYRFVAPATGTYQINCTTTTNDYVDYYYRTDNDSCNKTGWTCINRNVNSNTGLGAYNWNAGDTILLLLNAENASATSQSFILHNPAILPLKLLSFNIVNEEAINKLSWTTEAEINTDYFMIERSNNGTNFGDIAKVKTSNNNGITVRNYEYSDHFDHSGQNFYRLKMVDIDGAFTYSKTVVVSNKLSPGIQVFPNPVKNMLRAKIMYNKPANALIKITDLQGRSIQTQAIQLFDGLSNFDVDVSALPAGIYILKLNEENMERMFVKE